MAQDRGLAIEYTVKVTDIPARHRQVRLPRGVLVGEPGAHRARLRVFTGTQLFLMPEGHRSRPSVVRFDVPAGWKIASGLDETADPMVFTAPDYDTLVEQPTLMGQFDVTRFTVAGKPHGHHGPGATCPSRLRRCGVLSAAG
jgi:hypothetical protein